MGSVGGWLSGGERAWGEEWMGLKVGLALPGLEGDGELVWRRGWARKGLVGRKRGEAGVGLRGEVGESDLLNMKAVSVRLRWYRRNGFPECGEPGLVGVLEEEESCLKNSLGFMER